MILRDYNPKHKLVVMFDERILAHYAKATEYYTLDDPVFISMANARLAEIVHGFERLFWHSRRTIKTDSSISPFALRTILVPEKHLNYIHEAQIRFVEMKRIPGETIRINMPDHEINSNNLSSTVSSQMQRVVTDPNLPFIDSIIGERIFALDKVKDDEKFIDLLHHYDAKKKLFSLDIPVGGWDDLRNVRMLRKILSTKTDTVKIVTFSLDCATPLPETFDEMISSHLTASYILEEHCV